MADNDTRATFAVDVDGSGAAHGANEAEDATARLRKEIEKNLQALDQMGKSMGVLKKAGASSSSIKKLKDDMTALRATMKSNVEQFEKSGGSLASLGKRMAAPAAAKEAAGGMKALSSAVSGVGGPLARLVAQGRSVASIFGSAGVAGVAGAFVITAAAAVLVTAAIVGLVGALGHFALSAANAQRAELLMLEGMTRIPNWFGIAAGKATELQAAITAVSANVALGRDRIVGFAQDLYKAGLRGENLKQALEATSIATSAAGESYGSMVKGWLAGAGMLGGNVGKLAQQFKNRFGAVARAQMLDLNVQFTKMRENIRQLFSGLKIEGFLEALSKILGLFSDTTAVGRALKGTLELLLQPLLNGFERLQPIAKRFFQGLTIASLQFQIVVLKLRNYLQDTFGTRDLLSGIDWMRTALVAGEVAMWGFIAVAGLAAATVGLIAAPFVIAGVAITKIGSGVTWLYGKLTALGSFIASINWGESLWGQFEGFSNIGEKLGEWIGRGIVIVDRFFLVTLPELIGSALRKIPDLFKAILKFDLLALELWEGFKSGLAAGFTGVLQFVKGLAKGIIKGFADELKIGSPSRVFASFGRFTAVGYAQGINAGAPMAQGAVTRMVSSPFEASAAPSFTAAIAPAVPGSSLTAALTPPAPAIPSISTVSTSTVSHGGSNSIHIDNLNVTPPAGADARGFARSIADELISLVEGARASMGAPA